MELGRAQMAISLLTLPQTFHVRERRIGRHAGRKVSALNSGPAPGRLGERRRIDKAIGIVHDGRLLHAPLAHKPGQGAGIHTRDRHDPPALQPGIKMVLRPPA